MSEAFHGQSTKENYRSDIEDSLKQSTLHKLFEYFDDYSYSGSTHMGLNITKDKDQYYLYLFQDKGPKKICILQKLFEWRRSGNSNEVGHKGGGNKRLFYGMHSSKTSIFSNLHNKQFLFCEVNPNKIFDLAKSDIIEEEFRSKVDKSPYIKTPYVKENEDLPQWYLPIYNKLYEESGIKPNYLIRMNLTEIPIEFTNKEAWNNLVNQIRAKQYSIPILFKNEIINMETYKTYDNIDLIGLSKPTNLFTLELFVDNNYQFYLRNNYIDFKNIFTENTNTKKKCMFRNVSTGEIVNKDNLILWGTIQMFIADKEHISNQLKEYNNGHKNHHKQEDFYGVYFYFNGKYTNYKPVECDFLGSGKNNKIRDSDSNSTNRFRMIIQPSEESCQNKEIFDALIRTETIKALTGFLHKSPAKNIIKESMAIYRKKDKKSITASKKKEVKINTKTKQPPKLGYTYLIYLGNGLFKFGYCSDEKRYHKRLGEHKKESIQRVKEFLHKDMKTPTLLELFKTQSCTPIGFEEKIKNILCREINDNIQMFASRRSKDEPREYFHCENIDYVLQKIIPKIEESLN